MANYYLSYTAAQLDEAIRKVLSGELDVPLQEKTVTPTTEQQIVTPDEDYKGLSKVTVGAMKSTALAEPTITVDANGVVTVVIDQPGGYISASKTTTTYQLPTHSGGTYDNSDRTIGVKGKFMLDDITVYRPYTVVGVDDASYGFSINSSGYWESQNKGVDSSAALCRVKFELLEETTVLFECINYAEAKYDFGLLGLVDTALSTDSTADSSVALSFKGSSSTSIQTYTYTIGAGSHFVDVKFRKDSSSSSNNDSLQFKITINP